LIKVQSAVHVQVKRPIRIDVVVKERCQCPKIMAATSDEEQVFNWE
jgi:hypothetical protein